MNKKAIKKVSVTLKINGKNLRLKQIPKEKQYLKSKNYPKRVNMFHP